MNDNYCTDIFPWGPINNTAALVRKWLGANQVLSHYLNQWWYSLMTHTCVTWLQWVNSLGWMGPYCLLVSSVICRFSGLVIFTWVLFCLSIIIFIFILNNVRRATKFWVVVICPIIKCLTVLEFSFILFDLCLFITIFNFILNYVLIVTFWIFTYHKIWISLIIYCFIWNYWIIYFLTCLEVFWSVVS